MSRSAREGGSEELVRGGGAAALAEGWASDHHGDPRESPSSRGSPDAVALWGSLDPRAAERRARHHGRELERLAGRRVDDRIVSAGGDRIVSGPPRWAGRAGVLGPSLGSRLHPQPLLRGPGSWGLSLQTAEPAPRLLCGRRPGPTPSCFPAEAQCLPDARSPVSGPGLLRLRDCVSVLS